MSADNGVYVLCTVSTTKKDGIGFVQCSPYKVYRVAYTNAIDNFDWYKQTQPHNLGAYMQEIWGQSVVYTSEDEALLAAHKLAKTIAYLEYGVSVIDTDLTFYKD